MTKHHYSLVTVISAALYNKEYFKCTLVEEDLDCLIPSTSYGVSRANVDERPRPTFFLGIRHVQVMFYFLLMTYTYCMRTVLSLAIVAMNDRSITINPNIETFNWTNQSVVLSAFYWGYIVLQIPLAQSAKKFGAKWILVICVLVDSGSCMSIPTMATIFGSGGVMACRVVQGLAQGGVVPMTHTLLGCWAPPSERSVLGTITFAGSIFGYVLSLPLTGLICSSWIGWPVAFYLFGVLGLKWVVLWLLFGSNKPSEHKTITDEEKEYIQHSLGYDEHTIYKTPWKKILTSPPFWAITLAFVGGNWNSSVISTEIPTYLYKILEYDIKSNSLLSAAPYVAMGLCALIFGPICDWLINKNIVKRGNSRKIFNSIGTLLPAISLSILGFIPKEYKGWSLALLIFNGGVTAGGFCGFQINHVDLSPNHSGILMGITNSWTCIFAIIAPLIVQFIVTEQTNQTQWRTIFIISACVYLVTDIFFVTFASGEIQDWNELASSRTDSNKPIKTTKAGF